MWEVTLRDQIICPRSPIQKILVNNHTQVSVQFSRSVVSDSLWPHEPQHTRPPCPSPAPGVYSNTCPSSRWCHPAISSSVFPFSSCPQSLPASGPFPMSQLFTWGGQSIGVSASASVLPMNTQDLSPLRGLVGSPCSQVTHSKTHVYSAPPYPHMHATLCHPMDGSPPGSSFHGVLWESHGWEYWSGLPCPPSGDLPNPGNEPVFRMSPALTGRFFTTSTIWKALHHILTPKKIHRMGVQIAL